MHWGGGLASCVVLLVLICALLVAAFIDAEERVLPDQITIGGMYFILPAMVIFQDLRFGESDGVAKYVLKELRAFLPEWALPGWLAVVVLVLLIAAVFFGGCQVYRRYRRWRIPWEPCNFREGVFAGFLCALSIGLIGALCVFPEFEQSKAAYNLTSALFGAFAGSVLVFVVMTTGTVVFRKRVDKLSCFLIGYRGSGKTESGREAAALMSCEFIDTDQAVRDADKGNREIATIFKESGEAAFRDLEEAVLEKICTRLPEQERKPARSLKDIFTYLLGFIVGFFRPSEKSKERDEQIVIATGGGIVLRKENVDRMQTSSGVVIWLRASAEVLQQRIAGDPESSRSRPALSGKDSVTEVADVLKERDPLYKAAAYNEQFGETLVIDTEDLNQKEVGRTLASCLKGTAVGFGDVKLMGLMGALTGCWGVITGFFIACILGSIVGIPKWLIFRNKKIAFGPFLIVAGVFVYLWPNAVDFALKWYMGLFAG